MRMRFSWLQDTEKRLPRTTPFSVREHSPTLTMTKRSLYSIRQKQPKDTNEPVMVRVILSVKSEGRLAPFLGNWLNRRHDRVRLSQHWS
jgi:hypothetical protein